MLLSSDPSTLARLALPLRHASQLLEEACVRATDIQHCGLLNFVFDDRPEPWEVHGECMEGKGGRLSVWGWGGVGGGWGT